MNDAARRRRAQRESGKRLLVVTCAVTIAIASILTVLFAFGSRDDRSRPPPSTERPRTAIERGPPRCSAVRESVVRYHPARSEDVERHCRDDEWAPDVIACFTDATDLRSVETCYHHLSPEQQRPISAVFAPVTCDVVHAASARLVEQVMASIPVQFAPGPMAKDYAPKVADVALRRCREDGWPTEALVRAAEWGYRECVERLSPEQRQRLHDDIDRVEIDRREPRGVATPRPDAACVAMADDLSTSLVGLAQTALAQFPDQPLWSATKRVVDVHHVIATNLARVCTDDRWPRETVSCFRNARELHELPTCAAQLGAEAQAHYDRAMTEASP